jgi:hypothetical protein
MSSAIIVASGYTLICASMNGPLTMKTGKGPITLAIMTIDRLFFRIIMALIFTI